MIDSYILSKQSDYHHGVNDAYLKIFLKLYGYEERNNVIKKAVERSKQEKY